MNAVTERFVSKLKNNENVLGIILFGSWARGNNHPDSDVDLVVIQKEGYKRTVETFENQIFEIIYTTENSAVTYWESHKDDAFSLWEVGKILYDKDGSITKLRVKALDMLRNGKTTIPSEMLGQLKFDAEDQLEYVERIYTKDKITANMILFNKVFALTELFFDINGLWTPAPKQRLSKIKGLDSALFDLLVKFYDESLDFIGKVRIGREIVVKVFTKS